MSGYKRVLKAEIALVGFPNSGKTTLFNQLTGLKQKIGNWPGVTVEKKMGTCSVGDGEGAYVNVVDLPGIHSLLAPSDMQSIDAMIARQYLLDHPSSLLINVVDALYLERDLYLTHELLELGIPMMVILSKTTLAQKRGQTIDRAKLENQIGVTVIDADAYPSTKLAFVLAPHLLNPSRVDAAALWATLPRDVAKWVDETYLTMPGASKGLALHALEGDSQLINFLPNEVRSIQPIEMDTQIAEWRFDHVHLIAKAVLKIEPVLKAHAISRWDSLFLHTYLGLPSFFIVMYLLFTLSIGFGTLFQSTFDLFSAELFVEWPLFLGNFFHWTPLLTAILVGIGRGINTTFTFIPVLFFMYFFLSFLEQSGYMVRAAVIVDRLMRQLGLSGKAFVPLIIGFGCNVPAIMATRTLENPRDRIMTTLMSPFMSCGARLAIFSVFVALFFDKHAHLIVFSLYLIGILVAVITGLFVKRFMLDPSDSPLIIELPHFQIPPISLLLKESWIRVELFVRRTGRVIVPLCLLLTLLSRFDLSGQWLPVDTGNSILASIGHAISFIFYPMGISMTNWPAVIGLLSGTVAKEVVIGTLNTLYFVPDVTQVIMPDYLTFASRLLTTFLNELRAILFWLYHPLQAAFLASEDLDPTAGRALVAQFQSQSAAYAYLLFVLLYVPCFSTIAAIRRELNAFWAWFSVGWSLFMAYTIAVLTYQLLTFLAHPYLSIQIFIKLILLTVICACFLKLALLNKELKLV